MPALDCGHTAQTSKSVCIHLLEKTSELIARYFTGTGQEFHLICEACARKIDATPPVLKTVCPACFAALEEDVGELIAGRPEVHERHTTLALHHQDVRIGNWPARQLRDIQPVERAGWIVLFADGEIARLDFARRAVQSICRLSNWLLPESAALTTSADGRWLAVVDDRGSEGVVVDAANGAITMRLHRGDYHAEETHYPAAFFELDGEHYLVHATDWNRLDVSKPATGQRVTERTSPAIERGKPSPAHYLDYFHGRLTVSPDNTRIAEYGWVWHPQGSVRSWSLQRWLRANVWESEDGESVRKLAWSDYFWDGPLCWIGNHTLAIWGFGQDDDFMIPAVQVWDVQNGRMVRWFAGPEKGRLIYDGRHLCSTSENGTAAWDVVSGERLFHDPAFKPLCYHRGRRQFLSILDGGVFRLSRLDRPIEDAPVK